MCSYESEATQSHNGGKKNEHTYIKKLHGQITKINFWGNTTISNIQVGPVKILLKTPQSLPNLH